MYCRSCPVSCTVVAIRPWSKWAFIVSSNTIIQLRGILSYRRSQSRPHWLHDELAQSCGALLLFNSWSITFAVRYSPALQFGYAIADFRTSKYKKPRALTRKLQIFYLPIVKPQTSISPHFDDFVPQKHSVFCTLQMPGTSCNILL